MPPNQINPTEPTTGSGEGNSSSVNPGPAPGPAVVQPTVNNAPQGSDLAASPAQPVSNPSPVVPASPAAPVSPTPQPVLSTSEGISTSFSQTPSTPQPEQPTPPAQTPPPSNIPPTSYNPNAGFVTGNGGLSEQQIVGPSPSQDPKKKKIILGSAIAGVVLTFGILGFVFGYYIPNKPENVYSTGLKRSGKAVDKLVATASDKKNIDKFKKTELTGSLEINSDGFEGKGTFSSKFDETKFDGNFDLSMKSEGEEQKLGFKLLSESAKVGELPDSYLQVTGINAFGLDAMMPGIGEYDGKWISISKEYLKTLNPEAAANNNEVNFTYDDGTELAKAITKPTNEYLFNPDPKKAVLVKKEFVKVEKLDDITAYRYKMGFNKENGIKYCEALVNSVMSTNAYKKIVGKEGEKTLEEDKKREVENCKTDMNGDLSEDDTFDMWIDKKYKLIHKLRFADPENEGNYVDIGQKYKGGDQINMFANYVFKEGNAKFTLESNMKTGVSKGSFTAESKDPAFKFDAKGSFEAKPLEGELIIDKPTPTVPIQDVMAKFGIDESALQSLAPFGNRGQGSVAGRTTNSNDAEIQTDIRALQGQLEAYYAQNGTYPTLAELNNSSFRKTNMKGLEDKGLVPPGGTAPSLAVNASKTQYGYKVTCAASNSCDVYVLSGILSTGEVYKKDSLN